MIKSKAKILCVDNDPDLLTINTSLLRQAGYDVIEAYTGNECLQIVKNERPDLVLLDIMLPDISGIDVCRKIKENPELSNTYIILISGIKISSGNKIEGLELGADSYLVRPIPGQELIAYVQAILRLKEAEIALRKNKEQHQLMEELLKEKVKEISKLNEELEQRVIERTRQLQAVIEELETEIIDRKQTEKALKESEEKFRTITSTATDAIILVNDQGKISYWNPAAEKIFGYNEREAIGKDVSLFFVPYEYQGINKDILSIFKGKSKVVTIGRAIEFLAVKKDGTKFPVEISNSLINVKGRSETVGIIRDITERKLDEATLLQYAERLQSLSSRLIEVQEDERRNIAQVLQDEVVNSLESLKQNLEKFDFLDIKNIRESVIKSRETVKELIFKMRNMSLDLHPSILNEKGLLHSLLRHFDRFTKRTNIRINFIHNGLEERFSPEKEIAAYRIVQEALANIARHDTIDEVMVLIMANQDKLIINIEDKGRVFDPYNLEHTVYTACIKWMRQRLALIGGQLIIDSTPGGGTRLKAKIPLN